MTLTVSECPKCADILAQPAANLVYFWRPNQTEADIEAMGEQVRTLAVVMHAQDGHPLDPKEYPDRPWWRFWA